MSEYDLVVIGAGSGGVRGARMAASFGARVAIVESHALGGTCVNVGCVPKKLLVLGARYADMMEDARGFGWTLEGHNDWGAMRDRVMAEVARLNGVYGRILDNANVERIVGHGRIAGAHRVEVERDGQTQVLEAKRILVATGGKPRRPPIEGAELGLISDDFFALPALPSRVVLVGGGYIGVEFGSVLSQLGVDVHLVHRHETLLNQFDADVAAHFTKEFTGRVTAHLGRVVSELQAQGEGRRAILDDGSTIDADAVLYTAGRRPNTDDLFACDPVALGIARTERGGLVVDDAYRTGCESVFAVGDVIDHLALTPVALAEGMSFARRQFGGWDPEDARVQYEVVPTAVFATPEVGTVGLTERAARAAHDEVTIFRTSFRPMKYTIAEREARTLMKIVVDGTTDRVLGVHVVGPDAGEILQGFAAAMSAGATKRDLDRTIGIHPTAAEELVTMREPA